MVDVHAHVHVGLTDDPRSGERPFRWQDTTHMLLRVVPYATTVYLYFSPRLRSSAAHTRQTRQTEGCGLWLRCAVENTRRARSRYKQFGYDKVHGFVCFSSREGDMTVPSARAE